MINSKKKGFTIVELVIVVAVIAILAAVLIPTFSNLVKKANESADIQAVRNMNVYLAQAEATEGVNSILDVYEIFDESDYVVENYQPLYKGRYFFYDKQKNQILYVDEGGQVLFPADSKGDLQGTNDWFSLSTEIKLEELNSSSIKDETDTITYIVSKAEEYVWVVEQLNKGFNKNVIIQISNNLDFKGAQVTIKEVPYGKSLTIDGGNKTIKNITSNEPMSISNANDDEKYNEYAVAGLIAEAYGDVTISKLTLDNVNVKQINAGNVAILVAVNGSTTNQDAKTLKIEDVTINNSSVIGNRNVGAVLGLYDYNCENSTLSISNVKLNNVEVKTVVGFSGLLVGYVGGAKDSTIYNHVKNNIGNITTTNCTFDVYECELNTGACKGCNNSCVADGSNGSIHGYSYEVNGTPKCRKVKGENFNSKGLFTYASGSASEAYIG